MNTLARAFRSLFDLVRRAPESEALDVMAAEVAARVGSFCVPALTGAFMAADYPVIVRCALVLEPYGVTLMRWKRKDGTLLIYAKLTEPEPSEFEDVTVRVVAVELPDWLKEPKVQP